VEAEQRLVNLQKVNKQEITVNIELNLIWELIEHIRIFFGLKSHQFISAPSVLEVGLNFLLDLNVHWLHPVKAGQCSEEP